MKETADVVNPGHFDSGGWRLRVSLPDRREPELHEIDAPFAVIGRSSQADVCLSGSGLSYRHVYLQALFGGVFCVDLGSKSGTFLGKRRLAFGWLAGNDVLRVGRHQLTLDSEGEPFVSARDHAAGTEVPLDAGKCGVERLPRYSLEIWDGSKKPTRLEIDRVLSLVGRWGSCPVHLPEKSVSRVHCSLVLRPEGLWVVDLLGKKGIRVNDVAIRSALLEHGDKLSVGRYVIRAHLRETDDDLHHDTESLLVDRSSVVEASSAVGEEPPTAVAEDTVLDKSNALHTDWMGTLFSIEHAPQALIVLPNICVGSFRYAKLQAESNALRRKLEDPAHRNLMVDLQGLNYVGSEAIGVIIGLARRVTDRGGKVALCRASASVRDVMQNMGLFRLWQHYESRDEALRAIGEGRPAAGDSAGN